MSEKVASLYEKTGDSAFADVSLVVRELVRDTSKGGVWEDVNGIVVLGVVESKDKKRGEATFAVHGNYAGLTATEIIAVCEITKARMLAHLGEPRIGE